MIQTVDLIRLWDFSTTITPNRIGAKKYKYDHGFYVAPDTDRGHGNGPDRVSYEGNNYQSLKPMAILFPVGYPRSTPPRIRVLRDKRHGISNLGRWLVRGM